MAIDPMVLGMLGIGLKQALDKRGGGGSAIGGDREAAYQRYLARGATPGEARMLAEQVVDPRRTGGIPMGGGISGGASGNPLQRNPMLALGLLGLARDFGGQGQGKDGGQKAIQGVKTTRGKVETGRAPGKGPEKAAAALPAASAAEASGFLSSPGKVALAAAGMDAVGGLLGGGGGGKESAKVQKKAVQEQMKQDMFSRVKEMADWFAVRNAEFREAMGRYG